jgi:glycyl-tRNA synthetase
MKKESSLSEEIIDVALVRGFVFPSAEIYGGAAGTYDYGPIGTLITNKIINLWRQRFIHEETDHNIRIWEMSGSRLLPEAVFAASGHLEKFNDPLTQCKSCKKNFRADHVLEKYDAQVTDGTPLDELTEKMKEVGAVCPDCKGELSEVREFHMMFKTQLGATGKHSAYLRPETAQNIFVSFRRLTHSMRAKLPFGIAQVGQSYRNEISPRNFLIRMREFTQMELELFVAPEHLTDYPKFEEVASSTIRLVTREMKEKGEKPIEIELEKAVEQKLLPNQPLAYILALQTEYLQLLGVPFEKFWFRHMSPEETAHYSGGNYDLEVDSDYGVIEIVGNAYRKDHDLQCHAKASKTKLRIEHEGQMIVPHVVEPSLGLDRIFYTVLESCYRNDESRTWTWFAFPPHIAPIEVAVFPLRKKPEELMESTIELYLDLKDLGLDVYYDASGNIGKRYARADEIGIPFCVTVDLESSKDNCVTIRDRDSTEQVRVLIEDLISILQMLIDSEITFTKFKEKYSITDGLEEE